MIKQPKNIVYCDLEREGEGADGPSKISESRQPVRRLPVYLSLSKN